MGRWPSIDAHLERWHILYTHSYHIERRESASLGECVLIHNSLHRLRRQFLHNHHSLFLEELVLAPLYKGRERERNDYRRTKGNLALEEGEHMLLIARGETVPSYREGDVFSLSLCNQFMATSVPLPCMGELMKALMRDTHTPLML